jgi:hypothetical protein
MRTIRTCSQFMRLALGQSSQNAVSKLRVTTASDLNGLVDTNLMSC